MRKIRKSELLNEAHKDIYYEFSLFKDLFGYGKSSMLLQLDSFKIGETQKYHAPEIIPLDCQFIIPRNSIPRIITITPITIYFKSSKKDVSYLKFETHYCHETHKFKNFYCFYNLQAEHNKVRWKSCPNGELKIKLKHSVLLPSSFYYMKQNPSHLSNKTYEDNVYNRILLPALLGRDNISINNF